MSNAAFREANRRQYLSWGFEIAAAVAAAIWWQWPLLAFFWTAQQSIEARAVALARIASLFLPSPMLQRATIQVDAAGHVSTAPAILSAAAGPGFADLRFDAWVYLLLPPLAGILFAAVILYLAHIWRAVRKRRAEHVRGAQIDDRT